MNSRRYPPNRQDSDSAHAYMRSCENTTRWISHRWHGCMHMLVHAMCVCVCFVSYRDSGWCGGERHEEEEEEEGSCSTKCTCRTHTCTPHTTPHAMHACILSVCLHVLRCAAMRGCRNHTLTLSDPRDTKRAHTHQQCGHFAASSHVMHGALCDSTVPTSHLCM